MAEVPSNNSWSRFIVAYVFCFSAVRADQSIGELNQTLHMFIIHRHPIVSMILSKNACGAVVAI
jgi:hypothetical protein